MRTLTTILFLLTIFSNSYAQTFWNFDNYTPFGVNDLIIDTLTNPDNIWEIGAPNKNTFDSAYSYSNVLITDKSFSYPPNDTSVFYVKRYGLTFPQDPDFGSTFAFWYQMDTDSLADFGKIEVSVDYGVTWLDFINEDTTNLVIWTRQNLY